MRKKIQYCASNIFLIPPRTKYIFERPDSYKTDVNDSIDDSVDIEVTKTDQTAF